VTAADTVGARRGGAGDGRSMELLRAAAGPVICAVALTCLLSAWVASGGAGTLTRVRLQVTLAAVPMRAFTSTVANTVGVARVYLTIRNLSSTSDELIAVRSPIAQRAVLTQRGLGTRQTTVSSLPIPGNSTLTLSPITDDVVLEQPVPYEDTRAVPLTLVFRHAGQVTIDATVTAPGTP
jgi:copper(I)-binding protein